MWQRSNRFRPEPSAGGESCRWLPPNQNPLRSRTEKENPWLDLGNTPGGNQYYQSGNLGNVTTVTANGLPSDGSTVYATLFSLVGGQWLSNGYTYTAYNGGSSKGCNDLAAAGLNHQRQHCYFPGDGR